MSLKDRFALAVSKTKESKDLSRAAASRTSTEEKLQLYAYYKQARNGACDRPKPKKWEVMGKMKWEAWMRLGNLNREEAMQKYIDLLITVVSRLPQKGELEAFTNEVMLNSGNTSPSILSSDDEENDEQDITRAETSSKKRKDISRDNNGGDRASELMGMAESIIAEDTEHIHNEEGSEDRKEQENETPINLNSSPEAMLGTPGDKKASPKQIEKANRENSLALRLLGSPLSKSQAASRRSYKAAASRLYGPPPPLPTDPKPKLVPSGTINGDIPEDDGTRTMETISKDSDMEKDNQTVKASKVEPSKSTSPQNAKSTGGKPVGSKPPLPVKPVLPAALNEKMRSLPLPPSKPKRKVKSKKKDGQKTRGRSSSASSARSSASSMRSDSVEDIKEGINTSPNLKQKMRGNIEDIIAVNSLPVDESNLQQELRGSGDVGSVFFRIQNDQDMYLDEVKRHNSGARDDRRSPEDGHGDDPAFLASLQVVSRSTNISVPTLIHFFRFGMPPPEVQIDTTSLAVFSQLTYLDLSFGNLSSLSPIRAFQSLETLVADQNELTSIATCPTLPRLKTLTLNNNRIEDMPSFLDDAKKKFPQIAFLSLLGNPCCVEGPHKAQAPSESELRIYRLQIVAALPTLKFLDSQATASAPGHRHSVSSKSLAAHNKKESSMGGLSREELRSLISQPIPRGSTETADPLLMLAQVKLMAGIISKSEYVHILTVHRAVSVFMDDTTPETQSTPQLPPEQPNPMEAALKKLNTGIITREEFDHIMSVQVRAQQDQTLMN
eukprot:m.82784 g.82784  ORF g.82784 m.82784 type:complete len:781 (+) comp12887_c0_seq1:173-2515(+)